MATPQACERKRGDTKCSNHPKNDISLKCNQCGILVCIDCVSSEHTGHTFSSLSECFKQSKGNLHTHTWKLETKTLPSLRGELSNFNKILKEKENLHEDQVKYANEVRQKYIEDINGIFSTYISLIDKHSEETTEPVEKHINEVQTLESEVLTQIKQCKSVLETGTDLEIHDDENGFQGQPSIQMPLFLQTTQFIGQPYISIENAKKLIAQALEIVEELKEPQLYVSLATAENSQQTEALQRIMLNEEDNLHQYGWYHENIERSEGTRMLTDMKTNGAYLIRQSAKGSADQPYTLMVAYDDYVSNLKIRIRPDNQVAIGEYKADEKAYKDIPTLIQHLKESDLSLFNKNGKQLLTHLTIYPDSQGKQLHKNTFVSTLSLPEEVEPNEYQEEVIAEFQFRYNWHSLCPIDTDKAWVQEKVDERVTFLHLITSKGYVTKSIRVDGAITSLTFNHDLGKLYGAFEDGTVRKISCNNGRTRILINNQRGIHALAMLGDDLILGSTRVSRYSSVGDRTSWRAGSGWKQVAQTEDAYQVYDISTCPHTRQLAVAYGEDGLVVFDDILRVTATHTLVAYDVSFESHGNIVVRNRNTFQIIESSSGDCLHQFNVKGMTWLFKSRCLNSVLWLARRDPDKAKCVRLVHKSDTDTQKGHKRQHSV